MKPVRFSMLLIVVALTAMLRATPCLSDEIVARDRNLVKYATGIVYDTSSGLEWYAGGDQGVSWDEARDWVAGLGVFGGGWRMPSRSELDALSRIGDGVSNITPLLRNSGYWIWAGKTRTTSSRWVFSFSYGGEGWSGQAPADGGRVLAVRLRKTD